MKKKQGHIHAADSGKSARHQAVLRLLHIRGRQGATTAELAAAAKDMSVSTTISEIRANGYNISAAHYEGLTYNGRKVYRYFLGRNIKKVRRGT